MEWSKDKTLKLIELLQLNANLWNPSLCDTRRDKQKRKEELRGISDILGISVSDATKKIQHLRTQYNRESARETRANLEVPKETYISNWYAYEYLHFMKDSNKPYRVLQTYDHSELNGTIQTYVENSENKHDSPQLSSTNIDRSELLNSSKSETAYPSATRDEFSVFGEYIANELRSLKGEKNLLVAKKKIQDVIFEVKMGIISEPRVEQNHTCTVYTANQPHNSTIHSAKIYTTPVTIATIEPTHAPPVSTISEIIINGSCHYPAFKDEQ